MNYISAEEFLKQPEDVKKIFLDWWQPNFSDLIGENNGDFCLTSDLMSPSKPKTFKYKYIINGKYVPLLQIHQLIQFVEDKMGGCNFYYTDKQFRKKYIFTAENEVKTYEVESNNLLKALWQVAIKISEQEVEG